MTFEELNKATQLARQLGQDVWDYKQAEIDALQKRIDELEAKREGFKLVPKKCTNNMAHAAKSVDARLSAFKYSDVWDAMLSVVEEE